MNQILMYKGKIIERVDRYTFIVFSEAINKNINATISKTMKVYEGKELTVGNKVLVEMSPYDLSRGRIHRDTFIGGLNDQNLI